MRQATLLGAAMLAIVGTGAALAQTPDMVPKGPAPGDPYAQYYPDTTHIPFFRPDTIPWKGPPREQQYYIFGDPAKPGPYAMLLKWGPGSYSRPHFHGMPRYAVVVSGTWWVSSSTIFDPTKTYPLGPGSVVSDVVNTVHWDGAKDGPVVLMIVGDGPVPNINVDENGKPLPPRPKPRE
jgi:hypothetical protein